MNSSFQWKGKCYVVTIGYRLYTNSNFLTNYCFFFFNNLFLRRIWFIAFFFEYSWFFRGTIRTRCIVSLGLSVYRISFPRDWVPIKSVTSLLPKHYNTYQCIVTTSSTSGHSTTVKYIGSALWYFAVVICIRMCVYLSSILNK